MAGNHMKIRKNWFLYDLLSNKFPQNQDFSSIKTDILDCEPVRFSVKEGTITGW